MSKKPAPLASVNALGPAGILSLRWTATDVLEAVARWLGFQDAEDYNDACQFKPAEVRRRLREAP